MSDSVASRAAAAAAEDEVEAEGGVFEKGTFRESSGSTASEESGISSASPQSAAAAGGGSASDVEDDGETENMVPTGNAEAADRFKAEGNAHFKGGRFKEAVKDYTRSLSEVRSAPVLGNRAAAWLKLEDFGYAIRDAEAALEIDPSFVKAHYRRGSALMALGRLKEARRDLQAVVKLRPGDADAKARLKECTKQLKRIQFEEAIMTEETASVWDRLDLDSMEVPASYDGPVLDEISELPTRPYLFADAEEAFEADSKRGEDVPSEWGVSVRFCRELMKFFQDQKRLPKKYVYILLIRIRALFRQLPTLLRPELAPHGEKRAFTIVGDTHGQFYDLLNIFSSEVAGEPSPSNPILFNGDYVDRGPFSLEVVLTLMAWKLCYPRWFHMQRGNHETRNMNRMYGFEGEVVAKCDVNAMEMFADVFRCLPLASVVGSAVYVVHGGLFERDGVTLADVEAIDRFREPPEGGGDMSDILWADPHPLPGRGPSKRGVGKSFGPDITAAFLANNNLRLLVRSHEVKDEGYLVEHNGKCITVFSAPNYCDQMGNKGAVVVLDKYCNPDFIQFSEKPHPPARPMQYASGLARLMGMS